MIRALLLLSVLGALSGCAETLVNSSQPGKSMRNAPQYVRAHRGEGTRRTMRAPYAQVYEFFAASLEKTGHYTVSREENQIIAFYTNVEQLDFAVAMYFYRGPTEDQTEVEVLVASPWSTPQKARESEATILNNVAAELAKAPPAPAPEAAPPPPAPEPSPAAPPPAAGCGKDTDCKGDRICVKGECVEPSPTRGGNPR